MITVRRSRNWKGQPGYQWECTDHNARHAGFHRFNRFTDSVRRKAGPHPWSRAMSAAILHYHKHHAHHEKVNDMSGPIETRAGYFRTGRRCPWNIYRITDGSSPDTDDRYAVAFDPADGQRIVAALNAAMDRGEYR